MPSYFIRQNGQSVQGPFDEARIRGWIAQGRVRSEMELSADGQLWIPAAEHRLLVEALRPAPSVDVTRPDPANLPPALVTAWPPTPLPRGTEITYKGDRSTGFGLWGLLLHADPLDTVAHDEAGVSISLVLRHVRSHWTEFFDAFAVCVVGRVGVLAEGALSLGFRMGDTETWVPTGQPTAIEQFEDGFLSATRVYVGIPEHVLALAVPDQQVWMHLEVNGRKFKRKLRLGRLRSSLRAFVDYFRIEELYALWVRFEAGELSDEDLELGKQRLYAHTV